MSKSNLDPICSSGRKTRGLSKNTLELIDHAHSLLAANHPMTLRQLHYSIFSRQEIEYANDEAAYKRLSKAMTVARRAYRAWQLDSDDDGEPQAYAVPPAWMVDETRQPETVNVFENSQEYIDTVKRSYRRDTWQTQPHYCEVWSEKATVLGSVRAIANKWGVTTRVCHGYGSCGQETDAGSLFSNKEKDITVFYLGDHDPSGVHMEEDIHRRVERAGGIPFTMVRLAIHEADIKAFHLAPQKIKMSDMRAAAFKKRFGKDAPTVELDALPVEVLRTRIENAVSELIDHESWARQVAVQEVELRSIADFAQTMRDLSQIRDRMAEEGAEHD